MDDYEIISATIYKGNKKDKADCTVVHCSNKDDCELYKSRRCVLASSAWLLRERCPYGKVTIDTGYTTRAHNHGAWIKKHQEQYWDRMNVLKTPRRIIADVGDYVFLPYSHMNMSEAVPFLERGGFMRAGLPFLSKELFTVENIVRLCEFRPRSLMGGEITYYQHKVVPEFLTDLYRYRPALFAEVAKVYDRAKQEKERHTNVGREALLRTLNENVGVFKDIHGGEWTWDGMYLRSFNSHASFMPIDRRHVIEVRLVPSPDAVVKITDEDQVNDKTEFVA